MHVWNRAPLGGNAFAVLRPGTVRPRGWLATQLRLAVDGLGGRLPEVWADVGSNSAWLGGSGENWERGPYYVRGLLALAHTLGDAPLIERAQPWIEWSLGSQRGDGFFGPPNNDDWWARMPMLDALRWHHEATGDARVLPHMLAYFRYLQAELRDRPLHFWGKARGGDQLDQILWLYNRSGDAWLRELAELVHSQTTDWLAVLGADGPPDESFELGHGVNVAMGLKQPMVYSQLSRNRSHSAFLRRAWERLMAYHGQPHGLYSGDEVLHGRGSTRGTELCTIVELLSTFQTCLAISGEPWIAAAIERVAYNALPAMIAADYTSRQYYQLPNQIECTTGDRQFNVPHGNDLLFGLETGFGCCTANMHIGWPRLVQHMWMATADGGLAALLLGPCEITAHVGHGGQVRIVQETAYPFDDQVTFVVHTTEPVAFPLRVHIPSWVHDYSVFINDKPIDTEAEAGILLTVARTWVDADRLTLTLPMRPRVSRWDESVVVERGPLVYALRVGEDWRRVGGQGEFSDFEVHPTTPWNYGLRLHPDRPQEEIRIVTAPAGPIPWAQNGPGLQLQVPASRIPDWSAEGGVAGSNPLSRFPPDAATDWVTLIPYGCARLRISMFPVID